MYFLGSASLYKLPLGSGWPHFDAELVLVASVFVRTSSTAPLGGLRSLILRDDVVERHRLHYGQGRGYVYALLRRRIDLFSGPDRWCTPGYGRGGEPRAAGADEVLKLLRTIDIRSLFVARFVAMVGFADRCSGKGFRLPREREHAL